LGENPEEPVKSVERFVGISEISGTGRLFLYRNSKKTKIPVLTAMREFGIIRGGNLPTGK